MAKYHFTTDAQADLIQIRRYSMEQWGSIIPQGIQTKNSETLFQIP